MSSDVLKAFLRIGMFLVVASVFVLFLQTPGSAGFVVTVLSLIIGVVLVLLVALVLRWTQ